MLIKNLSTVTATAFAATPQNSEDEFQPLVNLLANNQSVYINADGTLADTCHPDKISVSQNSGSSLDDPQNVSGNSDEEFQNLIKLLLGSEPMNDRDDGTSAYTDPSDKTDSAQNTGLTRDPRGRFVDPQNVSRISDEELQEILDLFASTKEHLAAHPNPPNKTDVTWDTDSSLGNQENVAQTTTNAHRFAAGWRPTKKDKKWQIFCCALQNSIV